MTKLLKGDVLVIFSFKSLSCFCGDPQNLALAAATAGPRNCFSDLTGMI
jgi:hypothetical protein